MIVYNVVIVIEEENPAGCPPGEPKQTPISKQHVACFAERSNAEACIKVLDTAADGILAEEGFQKAPQMREVPEKQAREHRAMEFALSAIDENRTITVVFENGLVTVTGTAK